jgi:hypothetical protein
MLDSRSYAVKINTSIQSKGYDKYENFQEQENLSNAMGSYSNPPSRWERKRERGEEEEKKKNTKTKEYQQQQQHKYGGGVDFICSIPCIIIRFFIIIQQNLTTIAFTIIFTIITHRIECF